MKTSRQKQKLEIKGKLRTKLETEKDIKRIPLQIPEKPIPAGGFSHSR